MSHAREICVCACRVCTCVCACVRECACALLFTGGFVGTVRLPGVPTPAVSCMDRHTTGPYNLSGVHDRLIRQHSWCRCRFYGFSWWIMWFLFVIVVMTPVLLGTDSLKHFRGGLMAFVAIEIMLLMDMTNSFLYFNSVPTIRGPQCAGRRCSAACHCGVSCVALSSSLAC